VINRVVAVGLTTDISSSGQYSVKVDGFLRGRVGATVQLKNSFSGSQAFLSRAAVQQPVAVSEGDLLFFTDCH
jgi:hypothetical protein